MSSLETNNIKVPPPKPFRRRLSFRTKPSSETPTNSTSTLGNGLNSVRGSIRRFRRVSTTANNASSTNQNVDNDPNLTQEQVTTTSSTNAQPPAFPSFQRFREQTSRLKDINLTQKIAEFTATVQEMGSETVELGCLAKEAVVERLKKKKEEPSSNGLANSSPKNFAGTNIFGSPLTTAVRLTRIEKDINQIENDPYRYWLPAVMVRCFEFLDMYGLEEIGLYRIPGGTLTVTRMKNIFDSGADLNLLQSSAKDPHVVATLLKTYLRELPEPILTDALLPEFNTCVTNHTSAAVVAAPTTPVPAAVPASTVVPEKLPKALSNIVSHLPPQNFYLLRALCLHLSRVNEKNEINKMNISNLGVVFCPSLGIGSILFKTLVEHTDIVFGLGCDTEKEILKEEKKEQEAKERLAPEVYHKTNISGEFSRSFDDLLTLDAERVNYHSSNHSYPSSSSSSIIGLYVNKDTENENQNQSQNQTDSVKNHVTNNSTISPTLSSSSSITSPPTPPLSNHNGKDTNNPFSSDEFLSSIGPSSDSHEQRQRTVNIVDTAKTTSSSSSSKPSFRMRSRSTGLRDIPLTTIEYSSDSSEEEIENKKSEDSSSFMTFDYLDKHGTKNSGVLNLSPRPNWVLNHNGVRGNRNRATTWVRKRPSLEETEKWKKIFLSNINSNEPPDVIIGEDTIVHDDKGVENLIGKSKVRDQILKFNGMS
uniref:Putative Rho-type GTPase-activating protein 2 n=1 Tax=Anthurium amnicola TaxID=1678845 RepID=A0A1D1YNC8_9ARAE